MGDGGGRRSRILGSEIAVSGLLAYFTLRATAALKRAVVVYGLMALGALIAIFAFGYALNAGYTALMFRYGPIAASLTIAGGLLAFAAALILAARINHRRPRAPALLQTENPYAHVHLAAHPASQRAVTFGAALAGALTMVAAIVGFRRRRSANPPT